MFAGMISSMSKWNPTVALEIPLKRKATESKGKLIWADELDHRYVRVRKTMLEQISLKPS